MGSGHVGQKLVVQHLTMAPKVQTGRHHSRKELRSIRRQPSNLWDRVTLVWLVCSCPPELFFAESKASPRQTLSDTLNRFGFNGGSALGANSRAVSACLATHVAACAGGTTTVFLHWVLKQIYMRSADYEPREFRRLTAVHFCDGAIAGLVAITPGSGYVSGES